jgi:hypothetical protein
MTASPRLSKQAIDAERTACPIPNCPGGCGLAETQLTESIPPINLAAAHFALFKPRICHSLGILQKRKVFDLT